ncbi:MAG: dockerin type I repeat-containing protein [Bacteroidales bacterium]|nr:dockerin type I repeat-containing protein [Bacteroidales bacterium]
MKSVTLLAVIFAAIFFITIPKDGACQLLVENFDYPAGDLLTNHGWLAHSGAGTQAVTVNNGGLSFPGFNLSGIGNAALVDNTGEDVYLSITQQTSGTVYAAFMVNVAAVSAGYFIHLSTNPASTIHRGKVFVDATNHFGLSLGSNTGTYSSSTFSTNTTYLLVLKYQVNAGTSNDQVSLYVFNTNAPATEPASPTVGPLTDATQSDLNPASIALRQYSATQNYIVDGIRIATSWTDAIGVQTVAPTLQSANISFSNVTGNSMTAAWYKGNGEKRVAIISNSSNIIPPEDGTDPSANDIYQGTGQQVVFNGSDSTINITGLSSSTTYWCQVFEYNGTGINTKYSIATGSNNPNSQATLFVLQPPIVSDPTAASITSNSAIIGGNIISDGGSPISERGTVWSINSPISINDNKMAEGNLNTGIFAHLRSSLPAGTEIFYAAYAQNAIGTSISPESSFITLAEEPSNQATAIFSPLISYSTIAVSWDDNNGTQAASGFLIKGNTTGTFTAPVDGFPETDDTNLGDGSGTVNVTTGTNTYTWTSLLPSTTYFFAIYPYTNSGSTIDYKTSASTPVCTATTTAIPINIYTWAGANNADWNIPTNWVPARSTPEVADILQFNDGTTKTITAIPTQTISKILVSGNTKITLQSSAVATITIAGGTGLDLDITAGSELNLSGTNAITIAVSSTAAAGISGGITFTNGAHRLTGGTLGAVYFNSGSYFKAGSGFTGSPFGTAAPYNAIIFDNGSTYLSQSGSNPFGASAPNSVVVFQEASLFKVIAGVTAAFSGRTYGNFELDAIGATLTQTGTGAVSIQELKITNGTLNFNMTGTAGHSIKGDIIVNPGGTLNFSPTSAATVSLNGSSQQMISGGGTINLNTLETLEVNNPAGILLETSITLNGILALQGSIFSLNAGSLTLGSTASITGTFGASNMITASGTGLLKKEFPLSGGSFLFPLGDVTGTAEYSPVLFTLISGGISTGNYVGINLSNTVYPGGPISSSYIQRYWNLSSSGISGFSCDATFSYTTADVVGVEADLVCARMNPIPTMAGTVNTSQHQLTATGITTLGSFTGIQLDKSLSVSLFLEGLYAGSGLMNKAQNASGDQFAGNTADQVEVELHSSVPGDYPTLIYSSGPVNLSTNGQIATTIPLNFGGSYYLSIRHRNSIETVSAIPVSFSGSSITYNFTDQSNKAYGNNLKQANDGSYLLYAGDVNQDGLIDADDMILMDNEAASFSEGYLVTDLNGDGVVNITDIDYADSNASSFISARKP